MNTIAYLAPEIPALSATFVYEEILGLERRGFKIVSFSVRRPAHPANAQAALAARTINLYEATKLKIALRGLVKLPLARSRCFKALRWLLSDMSEIGWTTVAAWKLAFQLLAAAHFARTLLEQRCEHLHIHFAHTPTQIGMYASALSGIPFTITAHANDIFERGLLLKRKAERALRLLTISEYNRNYLEKLSIPIAQLGIVRCGVSFTANSAPEKPAGKTRFRMGTLGRMVEKKGFDVVLQATAILKKSGYDIELLIAGDGPLKHDLGRIAVECDVSDIVHFEGSLPHSKIASWLQTLDVFVLACKKDRQGDMDGIPVVLMEAMSQSIPVVSTRISGIPELILHEETGLLAEPGNATDFAQQIGRIMSSSDFSKTMTAQAATHVAREFGQEKNLDRLIAAFNLSDKNMSHTQ